MSYKYSKGNQIIGDLSGSDDANRNTGIDFEEDYISLRTNDNDVLVVSGSNVGIGVATPIAELDVAGKIAITSEVATPTAPADGKGWLYTKSDGKIYWQSSDVSETDLTSGGGGSGISFDGSTADGILTYKDSDEATVESNFTFDAVSQTAMISGSLHLRGEERITSTEFSTNAERERSFTLRKHIQISTTTTNSWIDIISWQPKVVGGASNPGADEFWAAVSFEINLTGHYNGVGNSHRRMEGVVFYMGSSASSANGYNNDTARDATAVPNFRVNLSGWTTTLQYNLDNGSAQGFQGMAYLVIHFTRGAGNEGNNIYWDVT